jgi:NADP-dependent 3-hydroxy acid dehydrogenase YdfG
MLRLSSCYTARRAFVTGAASGLGRAFAHHLAADGWTLGLADVNCTGLDAVAETVRRMGGTPHPVELDVADGDAFQDAADAFVRAAGGVDLVVNNAGIGAGGLFDDTPLADWHAVLNVNLMGVVHGCHAFADALADGGGHVVNVASLAAVAAFPRMSVYNVSKAGVRALSETLYGEWKAKGVHVAVLLPGFLKTNIDADLRGSEADRRITQTMMQRSPLTAHDVAHRALEEAGRDRIHILDGTWMSRAVWHGKRLAPAPYVRTLPKQMATVEAAVAKMDEGAAG